MLRRDNPYAKLFENYRTQLDNSENGNLSMVIQRNNNTNQTRTRYEAKRYNTNAPGGQIAAIFTADDEGFPPDVYVNFFSFLFL